MITQIIGAQKQARDVKNVDNVSKLVSFMEAYYALNSTLPSTQQLLDANWRTDNGFNSKLLVDSEGKQLTGLDQNATNPSKHVGILLLPDPYSASTCAAMFSVRHESNNTIETRYVGNCEDGGADFDSHPTDGSCPTLYSFTGGNVAISKDDSTGLCVAGGSALY